MGLPRAIQAHREGDLALAETHYKRALDQEQYKPELFQNYGALLRANGHLDQSKVMYLKGLEKYPRNLGIMRNYANLLKEKDEISEALKYSMQVVQCALVSNDNSLELAYCDFADLLIQVDSFQWALAVLRQAFSRLGVKSSLLWALFKVSSAEGCEAFGLGHSQIILNLIEQHLGDLMPLERAEFLFARAFFQANREKPDEAVESVISAHKILRSASFRDSEEFNKAQKLMNVNSWNTSCVLLKVPRFDMAWKLFEYGLRAPASGRQRWQRHLKKLFTHQELPLWRGDDLKGQRLLLLEEQAIGDTMMFLTLLPSLVDESKHVGLVLSKRLLPIYRRSYSKLISSGQISIWSHDDVATNSLRPDFFDYQSPVGSVCQYRFTNIESFAPRTPVLEANADLANKFKDKLSASGMKPLRIGISWRGGGRSDRIKLKSIDEEVFAGLMRDHKQPVSFVNLQYGDVSSVLSRWKTQGLPVIQEPSVNPLKDMDAWLNLVASCDAVISVANTTIHGAGGLNIPTLCLLSQHSDWRWLNDSRAVRSYWYPSVGIARERQEDGWSFALKQVRAWIDGGCPMPDGPVHTSSLAD